MRPIFVGCVDNLKKEMEKKSSVVKVVLWFGCAARNSNLKSDNLQYNTLGRWVDGTNDSSTKHLIFQAFFFSYFLIDLGHSKVFIFIFVKGIPIRKWRDTFGRGFANFWDNIFKFGTEVNFFKKINSLLCQD